MKGARLVVWVALGVALGYAATSSGQTLTVPLPAGCTPALSGNTVVCGGGTTPPPVCAPTPPVCPTQPPAGCAPCTPPPEPPAVSCGELKVLDGGEFTFNPQDTRDIALGRGDREVYIMRFTPAVTDSGKRSQISAAEHGSGAHTKTVWMSRTKCEMIPETQRSSTAYPTVQVSVNGTAPVNMAPGETWYYMIRNIRKSGGEWRNTCGEKACGERITAYMWASTKKPAKKK